MEEDNGGAKRRKKRQAEQYSGGGEDKKESGRVKGVLETDSQKLSIMDTSRNQQQERPATGGDKAGKDGEDFQEALLEEAIAKHKARGSSIGYFCSELSKLNRNLILSALRPSCLVEGKVNY